MLEAPVQEAFSFPKVMVFTSIDEAPLHVSFRLSLRRRSACSLEAPEMVTFRFAVCREEAFSRVEPLRSTSLMCFIVT